MSNQHTIPLLTALDIECRVQSVSKQKSSDKVGAVLLLYKDARVDMRILDQVYGPTNWQRTHEVINGNLFCNIDIWDAEKNQWVRKQDVGVESNTAKEKGQASDAFKRAAFNLGIGRELYTSPFIYIVLEQGEYYTQGDTVKCSSQTKFDVAHVAYTDDRDISELVIIDRNGTIRFDMKNKAKAAAPPAASKTAPPPKRQQVAYPTADSACPVCGGPITDAERNYSQSKYGSEMCRACQQGRQQAG